MCLRSRILLALFILSVPAAARKNYNYDSLLRLSTSVKDTQLVMVLNHLSEHNISNHPDSAIYYGHKAVALAKKINFVRGLAWGYEFIGSGFNGKGIYDSSLYYFFAAYKEHEKTGNKYAMTNIQNSIGNGYLGFGKYDRALEAFLLSNALAKKAPVNEYMIAVTSVGIGNIFLQSKKPDSALVYFQAAADYFHKLKYKSPEATCFALIGSALSDMGNKKEAIVWMEKAIIVMKEVNDLYALGETYMLLGDIKRGMGSKDQAMNYYLEGYKIHKERNAFSNLYEVCNRIADLSHEMGFDAQAYTFAQHSATYKDSIINEKAAKQVQELEAKFETEKKEKILALQKIELEKNNLKSEQQTVFIYLFSASTLVFLFLAFFVFRSYRQKRKANLLLERQNKEVIRKAEEINMQKSIIEAKNKDITDSIRYAQHIQEAILPPDDLVYELLQESFVLYMPKDIVSGDFYYVRKIDDRVIFAVVDCTGHGVPGAFMSVLAHSAISGVLQQQKVNSAAILLNFLADAIKETFRHHHYEASIADGMDIAVCILDRKKMNLQFAGAKNPVVWISKGKIVEFKGDKQVISGTSDKTCAPFTNHVIDLNKGDSLYIFSDGFADQFGGPSGKKFKFSRLKDFLISISEMPLYQQKQKLTDEFLNWKGELEQVDDVCMMGVRV
jgi:serine phosphatase RsbU (regulator of sigma subunit)